MKLSCGRVAKRATGIDDDALLRFKPCHVTRGGLPTCWTELPIWRSRVTNSAKSAKIKRFLAAGIIQPTNQPTRFGTDLIEVDCNQAKRVRRSFESGKGFWIEIDFFFFPSFFGVSFCVTWDREKEAEWNSINWLSGERTWPFDLAHLSGHQRGWTHDLGTCDGRFFFVTGKVAIVFCLDYNGFGVWGD